MGRENFSRFLGAQEVGVKVRMEKRWDRSGIIATWGQRTGILGEMGMGDLMVEISID